MSAPILRLFGVGGLDSAGRPLAGATVDRWLSADPRGLATGITLPFAMALLEYDLQPQQLALDVASGAIDLSLEAELLRQRDRRAVAEVEAFRLAGIAMERIDAQRTVRHETLSMLGDVPRPWLATTLAEPDLDGALEEVAILIDVGFDLLRVEIPINRATAPRLCSARPDGASHSSRASSATPAIKGKRCKPPSPAPAVGSFRSCAAATGTGSSCCRKDGSWSAPWPGSAAVVGWHATMSVTLARRPRSSVSQ